MNDLNLSIMFDDMFAKCRTEEETEIMYERIECLLERAMDEQNERIENEKFEI